MSVYCQWSQQLGRCLRKTCDRGSPCRFAFVDPCIHQLELRWLRNEVIAGRTAAYAESLNVSRETISSPTKEDHMNPRPETISDVRQNADEREPIAVLRATDPYAVELLDVYSHLLLGDGAAAIEHWEELWKKSVRERASSDEGNLRTRGGMAHQLSCKLREFRERGPLWRVAETHVMRDGTLGRDNPLGKVCVLVHLIDDRSEGRHLVRRNARQLGTVLEIMDMIYGPPRNALATIAHTIATSDDWCNAETGGDQC